MPRKKTPTNTNVASAAINLDDDEVLVERVTTEKQIGRQRRTPAAEETVTVEPEPDDDELELDDDGPEFAEGSLAAVLFGESDHDYENEYCNIQIRRNPDSMNDNFLTKCGAVQNLLPMRNIELTADKMDIEERVRAEYGGGHYFFQIHYNGALRKSWRATLADDPAVVRRAKDEQTAAAIVSTPQAIAPATPPADPLDSFLANAQKMKALKDVLFGDEETRMKAEIERLRTEIETRQPESTEPKSETLQILEKALTANNPTLQDKLLDYAFPSPEANSRHWIADLVSVAMENKDTILGFVGSFFGPPPAAQPATNFDALMRSQPPPVQIAEPARSAFRRGNAEPETTDADLIRDTAIVEGEVTDDEPNDAGGNAAEQTSEGTENADAAS